MHPETTPGQKSWEGYERLLCGGAIVIGIRNYKAVTSSGPGMEEQAATDPIFRLELPRRPFVVRLR
jgi:hypothetical protein